MSLISDIKKNIERAGTTIMQRVGIVDRTVDKAFDEEYGYYNIMKQNVYQLLKDSRRLIDAVHTLNTAQEGMFATLVFLTHQSIHDGESPADTRVFEMELTRTLYEPLLRFTGYFTVVDQAVKERQHLLLKYDQQREKVRQLLATKEEEADDDTMLRSAQQTSHERREKYDALNQTLIHNLQRFTQLCEPYLSPSVEALCQSEHKWAQKQYWCLTERGRLASDVQDVNDLLNRMRSLSICSNTTSMG